MREKEYFLNFWEKIVCYFPSIKLTIRAQIKSILDWGRLTGPDPDIMWSQEKGVRLGDSTILRALLATRKVPGKVCLIQDQEAREKSVGIDGTRLLISHRIK